MYYIILYYIIIFVLYVVCIIQCIECWPLIGCCSATLLTHHLLSVQVFYVDHNTHCTTFIDPRLPYPGDKLVRKSNRPAGMVSRMPLHSNIQGQPAFEMMMSDRMWLHMTPQSQGNCRAMTQHLCRMWCNVITALSSPPVLSVFDS